MNSKSPEPILLTGATGYVGGHLLRRLQDADYQVRCLTRRPAALTGATGPRTEVVAGDLLDRDSLAPAMSGVKTAYYLHISPAGTRLARSSDARGS